MGENLVDTVNSLLWDRIPFLQCSPLLLITRQDETRMKFMVKHAPYILYDVEIEAASWLWQERMCSQNGKLGCAGSR